jgi:acyl dehydratase
VEVTLAATADCKGITAVGLPNHDVELTPFSVEVACGRLQAFAAATGQDDPVYSDVAAAHAAGYPSLPVPPTFLFCLEMEGPKPMEAYERLGIDYAHVLHGEQHFRYHRMAFAGETLRFAPRISDRYEKKGGSLKFFVRRTRVEAEDGSAVADLRSVFVVRDPRRGTPA